jgi:hypothetical protein
MIPPRPDMGSAPESFMVLENPFAAEAERLVLES